MVELDFLLILQIVNFIFHVLVQVNFWPWLEHAMLVFISIQWLVHVTGKYIICKYWKISNDYLILYLKGWKRSMHKFGFDYFSIDDNDC